MRALSRKSPVRKSMLRNLATSFILYERIKTTSAKAKEVKPLVEHLINAAKKEGVASRRRLMGYLFDENAVKKTLEELVPRYKNIPSGFIKTYKLGARLGDGAQMMILELMPAPIKVEKNKEVKDAEENITSKQKNKSTLRNSVKGRTEPKAAK